MVKFLGKLFIKDYQNIQNPKVANNYGKVAGIFGIMVNLLLSIAKIIMGLLTSSIAILSDGINNLSDAGGSLVTAVGFKMASLPADDEHPFGHQRIQYISGLIVSFLVLFIGLILGYESIQNIMTPKELDYTLLAIIVMGFSILAKIGLYAFYKATGKLINSHTLDASAMDSLTDCESTGAVLIAIGIQKITGVNLDGVLGLIVSIIILIQGIKLIKSTTSPLLGEAPSQDFENEIMNHLKSYPGVLDIHDVVIHSYGTGDVFVTAHLEFDENKSFMEVHELCDTVEHDFLTHYHIFLTTHADPVNLSNETIALKQQVIAIVQTYNEALSVHDFRVVPLANCRKIIFDVKVPSSVKIAPQKIKEDLTTMIKSLEEHDIVIIDIDEEYEIF